MPTWIASSKCDFYIARVHSTFAHTLSQVNMYFVHQHSRAFRPVATLFLRPFFYMGEMNGTSATSCIVFLSSRSTYHQRAPPEVHRLESAISSGHLHRVYLDFYFDRIPVSLPAASDSHCELF